MLRLLLFGILATPHLGCAQTPPPADPGAGAGHELAVYALSRGKGVPDEARAALSAARDLFTKLQASGQVLRVVEQRMGFEGERRVCAVFVDAKAAAAARDQLLAQSGGADLFNIVLESCDRPSQKHGGEQP